MQSRVKTRGKWLIIDHSPHKGKRVTVKDESKTEKVEVTNTKSEKETK